MKTPLHLWIVGVFAVVWTLGGAFDYVMTQAGNAEYLAMLTDAQRAFLDEGPAWFEGAWAVGVWFSLLGALLLLLRSRLAGAAFAGSFLGLVVSSIYSFGIADRSALEFNTGQAIFTAAIYIVLILLWIYARVMTRRGVLR